MSTREDPEFNIVSQRFEYEDEEGQSWDQDPVTKQWHPILTAEQIAAQQAAYSVPGVDETAPAVEPKARKRKQEENYTGTNLNGEPHAASDIPQAKREKKEDPNRPKSGSVYVQNLPPNTTAEELAETFQKCGILLEDAATSKPRIKIYTNPDGSQKGDALVIYFREESVSLAITMLDDIDLRGTGHCISVSKATFKSKPNTTTSSTAPLTDAPPGSASGPAPDQDNTKTASQTDIKEKKPKSKIGKLRAKLSDWDEDDMSPLLKLQNATSSTPVASALTTTSTTTASRAGRSTTKSSLGTSTKAARTVYLLNMFTLQDLEDDPTLLLDLKQDVRDECTDTCGPVTSVTLYDLDPQGAMGVKFAREEDAEKCVRVLAGRYFGGRIVHAFRATGKEKFAKSGKGGAGAGDGDDDDVEEAERLAKFGKWLEGDEDGDERGRSDGEEEDEAEDELDG